MRRSVTALQRGARITVVDQGIEETRNLSEILAISMKDLSAITFPLIDFSSVNFEAGVVRRMSSIGSVLRRDCPSGTLQRMASHRSDVVRGWVAFAIGEDESRVMADRLASIRRFAADQHFGVREWAWLAVREMLREHILDAIPMLSSWTASADPFIRRFAVEATRPRGVWSRHIATLREDPEQGLAVIEPMKFELDRYAQDSVANWLNDAGKDHPDWVTALLRRWSEESASPRIVKRAARNLISA
ncbi:MAG: DNA alkylation repair protein [Sphingomonadaceae bacterium]|nr:DNA alkylation repair protein [Sphingomonadaceae bacterium]